MHEILVVLDMKYQESIMNNNYLEQIKQAFSDMPTWFVCIFTGIVFLSAIFSWSTGYALNRENLIDRV